jgi:hypothetical protein
MFDVAEVVSWLEGRPERGRRPPKQIGQLPDRTWWLRHLVTETATRHHGLGAGAPAFVAALVLLLTILHGGVAEVTATADADVRAVVHPRRGLPASMTPTVDSSARIAARRFETPASNHDGSGSGSAGGAVITTS